MFTGIVETRGMVKARDAHRLLIQPQQPFRKVVVGESVAVDGVCLSVDELMPKVPGTKQPKLLKSFAKKVPGTFQGIAFHLLPETVRATTLGCLRVGDWVNLERALRVGDRLGGHLLLGHVDGQGSIVSRIPKGRSLTLGIQVPSHVAACLVPKGPIAVDGVSLTLDPAIPRGSSRIRVHLIPHTAKATTLGKKPVGSQVNLEVDLIAKYLFRMLY